MTTVRVASYNVENLFARPRAFARDAGVAGDAAVLAHAEFNRLIANPVYSAADRARMRDLLVTLGIYVIKNGAVRRSTAPQWAWLRKNRGDFDREPVDKTKDVEITATGRADWLGWAELVVETPDEKTTRLTAQVIAEVNADIIAVVEAENRPALARFNRELVGLYRHVMLVDGNDERGIDVGLMTKSGFEIGNIRSHVDDEDAKGQIFSRDCADYEVLIPGAAPLHVLVNHFKSQSGGGGDKRKRQAAQLRTIVDDLVASGERAVVLGDFNEGQADEQTPSLNFARLFDPNGPLVACFDIVPQFDPGPKPGTFDSCGIRNRLDYIFLTKNLVPCMTDGGLFRKGLWGTRKTRPTAWTTYPEMASSCRAAPTRRHRAATVRT